MRFLFKTGYEDDIRLFPHSGYVLSYGTLLALLVIAPFVLSGYLVSQLVFVCIYAAQSSPSAPTPRRICSSTTCRFRSTSSQPAS